MTEETEEADVRTIVKTGIVIGVAVAAWTLVMGMTGWYLDPDRVGLFWVVVLLELVGLVLGLRRTAAERGYWRQVGAGAMIALVAAVLVFASSVVFTTVVFPDYFDDLATMQRRLLVEQRVPTAEVETAVEVAAPMRTPATNAALGAVGTVVTGLLASFVIAIFVRRKQPPAPLPPAG